MQRADQQYDSIYTWLFAVRLAQFDSSVTEVLGCPAEVKENNGLSVIDSGMTHSETRVELVRNKRKTWFIFTFVLSGHGYISFNKLVFVGPENKIACDLHFSHSKNIDPISPPSPPLGFRSVRIWFENL